MQFACKDYYKVFINGENKYEIKTLDNNNKAIYKNLSLDNSIS